MGDSEVAPAARPALLEHHRAFVRYLERRFGDPALAEDILQDALLPIHFYRVKAYAERQGLTAGNAAVRVFRAREALKRRVVEWCGTCAEHGCLNCICPAV